MLIANFSINSEPKPYSQVIRSQLNKQNKVVSNTSTSTSAPSTTTPPSSHPWRAFCVSKLQLTTTHAIKITTSHSFTKIKDIY
jgi:hypothetical protein